MKITKRPDGVIVVAVHTAKGLQTIRATNGTSLRQVQEAVRAVNRNTRDANRIRGALEAAGLLDHRCRLRKPAGTLKTAGLTLRLTEAEKSALLANAATAAVTPTALIVARCCGKEQRCP